MSYHIYTSLGIILKRVPFGEANILLHVLTKEFGLVIASARSARVSESKLRPALQEYTLANFSLVKGKNGWKITNVSAIGSFYFGLPEFTNKVMSQVSNVLLQMIQGETREEKIFEIVYSGFNYLKQIDKEEVSLFEVLIVLRILKELGYVTDSNEITDFVKDISWNSEILEKVKNKKVIIVSHINKALKESHL